MAQIEKEPRIVEVVPDATARDNRLRALLRQLPTAREIGRATGSVALTSLRKPWRLLGWPTGVVVETYQEVLRRRRDVLIEILTLDEANRAGLMPPDGTWRLQVPYIEHPYRPGEFHPLDEAARRLLQDEQDEFVRLARSLGATRIHIEGAVSRRSLEKEGIDVSAPTQGPPVGAGIDFEREQVSSTGQALDIQREGGSPALPTDLVWFEHRPESMQLLARERLEGATSVKHKVDSREARRVQAGVKAKVADLGFRLTGGQEHDVQTSWSYEVEFPPLDREQ